MCSLSSDCYQMGKECGLFYMAVNRTLQVVQWLRPHTPNARGLGFDLRSGNYISHATTKSSHAATKWQLRPAAAK